MLSWSYFFRNPAVHIAFLALFCGSQAIHVISLKNQIQDHESLVRKKIRLLNEVLERIKAGEAVDVKEMLGTGDPEKEKEWQDGTLK
jgi:Family of unknown function (DUF5321)